MGRPKTVEELEAALNAYFQELFPWQKRVNERLEALETDEIDDPPPEPPDLGA
jgi:hypothetical protein